MYYHSTPATEKEGHSMITKFKKPHVDYLILINNRDMPGIRLNCFESYILCTIAARTWADLEEDRRRVESYLDRHYMKAGAEVRL